MSLVPDDPADVWGDDASLEGAVEGGQGARVGQRDLDHDAASRQTSFHALGFREGFLEASSGHALVSGFRCGFLKGAAAGLWAGQAAGMASALSQLPPEQRDLLLPRPWDASRSHPSAPPCNPVTDTPPPSTWDPSPPETTARGSSEPSAPASPSEKEQPGTAPAPSHSDSVQRPARVKRVPGGQGRGGMPHTGWAAAVAGLADALGQDPQGADELVDRGNALWQPPCSAASASGPSEGTPATHGIGGGVEGSGAATSSWGQPQASSSVEQGRPVDHAVGGLLGLDIRDGGEGSAVHSEDGRAVAHEQESTLASRVARLESVYGACSESGSVGLRERMTWPSQQWLQVEHAQHCPTCREHPEGAQLGALDGVDARPG